MHIPLKEFAFTIPSKEDPDWSMMTKGTSKEYKINYNNKLNSQW